MSLPCTEASLSTRLQWERQYRYHRDALNHIRPSVDTSPPDSLDIGLDVMVSRARAFRQNERRAEIGRSNRKLVDKLFSISKQRCSAPGTGSSVHVSGGRQSYLQRGSLNEASRRKETRAINAENEALVKRIMSVRTTFNTKALDNDYRKHLRYSKMIGRFSTLGVGAGTKLQPLALCAEPHNESPLRSHSSSKAEGGRDGVKEVRWERTRDSRSSLHGRGSDAEDDRDAGERCFLPRHSRRSMAGGGDARRKLSAALSHSHSAAHEACVPQWPDQGRPIGTPPRKSIVTREGNSVVIRPPANMRRRTTKEVLEAVFLEDPSHADGKHNKEETARRAAKEAVRLAVEVATRARNPPGNERLSEQRAAGNNTDGDVEEEYPDSFEEEET